VERILIPLRELRRAILRHQAPLSMSLTIARGISTFPTFFNRSMRYTMRLIAILTSHVAYFTRTHADTKFSRPIVLIASDYIYIHIYLYMYNVATNSFTVCACSGIHGTRSQSRMLIAVAGTALKSVNEQCWYTDLYVSPDRKSSQNERFAARNSPPLR